MNRIRDFWERKFLLYEGVLSLLLSVAFLLWVECFSGDIIVNQLLANKRVDLYGVLAAIFGSLLGFVITALSIVIGYASSEKMRILRESKQYKTLWSVFTSTIRSLGLATVLSLLGLILDQNNNIILYLGLFGVLLAIFRLIRSVWVLENIIQIVTKKRSE